MEKKLVFKFSIIFVLFFMMSNAIFSQIERYNLMDLNGVSVYFPKENKAYINEILNSEDPDKLLYLSEMYLEMREQELALYFFNNYTGFNWEFKKKIANKLGIDFFTKELIREKIPENQEYKNYFLIKSIDNIDDYLKYFSLKDNKEKSIYEKLYKYKYDKKTEEFSLLYEELSKGKNSTLEEKFLLELLADQYEKAKKIVLLKPQLCMDFLYYMQISGVKKELIKSFVSEFKTEFGENYKKEILLFEIKYLLNDIEKVNESEKYLKISFDEDIFEEYFKLSKNITLMKEYLIDLVFEKSHEKYINYLILLDKSFEDEVYLAKLFDKSYLFKQLEKNGKPIKDSYEKEYIEYLINEKNYKKLFEYKEKLSFDQLKILKNMGYDVNEIVRKKYPLKLEFVDLNEIKYFYFNPKLIYDEIIIKELERKKQLNSVETYYLSRYYEFKGQKEKAADLKYILNKNYSF